jgi:hypothetical protein
MNTRHEDHLWSAYLDGELTASEALEVDDTLTDAERERLAGELRVERLLAERLSAAPPCPQALWESTVARMGLKATRRPFPVWRAASLAAAFLVALSLFLALRPNDEAEFLAKAANIDSLRQQAQVMTPEEVQALLLGNGMNVQLRSLEEIGIDNHNDFLIGANATSYAGERVVQVLYGCCGSPAKVVIVKRGGSAAARVADGVAKGQVQACCAVDGHVVAVVGPHGSPQLLHVVQ